MELRGSILTMDINRFTEKAQSALRDAQALAVRLGQQQIDIEHLFLSLLDQENGLAPAILGKADISAEALKIRAHREVERLPKVSGAGSEAPSITGRLNRLLVQAEDEAVQRMLARLAAETEAGVLSPDVEFKEYDEEVGDEVEFCECPRCGHRWPR